MRKLVKYIFLILGFLNLSDYPLFASSLPSDTLRQKKINGIPVKLYKVQAKDTWSSISKKTKVSMAYLTRVNEGVSGLKNGQIINIPTEENFNSNEELLIPANSKKTNKPEIKTSKYEEPVYHTVKKGETLFHISKLYKQSLENIVSWNEIKNNDLKTGQKLIVKYTYQYKKKLPSESNIESISTENKEEIEHQKKVTSAEKNKSTIDNSEKNEEIKPAIKLTASAEKGQPLSTLPDKKNYPAVNVPSEVSTITKSPSGKIIKQVNETGVATWIMDGEISKNNYYALHRSAPIGTIIKVVNRMNGKYVFVKVVGLLPDTGDNDHLIIKISQVASNKINVLDSRFQAELSYGIAE